MLVSIWAQDNNGLLNGSCDGQFSVYIGAVAIMEFEKKEFIFVPDLPSYVPGIISKCQSSTDR